jgi:AraC-like DNA-binding protein
LFGLTGRSITRLGTQTVEVQPEQSCVLSGDADFTTDFGAGYEQLVLRIEKQALLKNLSALIGSAPPKRIEFSFMTDAAAPQARNLRRLILNFAHQMSSADVPLPKPVLEEMQHTIAVAFLCCNQHNLSRLIEREEKACTPWQVRSVEDYIEANWAEAMTIEKLAAVTNTSARSIFAAFKKSRGYTPMAFAKSIRLKNARAMLERADSSPSVTEVALECGFGNLGHFARDYREAFGELPSITRSRRRVRS